MTLLRIPRRRFYGQAASSPISTLLIGRTSSNVSSGRDGREVFGYKLPAWQRPACWTDAQCSSFVESVYLGANIGNYMLNSSEVDECHDVLVDGQQRLRALELYVAGRIPLTGEDGSCWLWHDLTPNERARFERISFPFLQTSYSSDEDLIRAYERHNFGGVPHLPGERAGGQGYRGDNSEGPQLRVPRRRFYGQQGQTLLGILLLGQDDRNRRLDADRWDGRRILGYRLPEWQRPARWDDPRASRYIESIYLGANVGHYMLNATQEAEFDQILLDGQQRLSAVERYVRGELAVPGEDGVPRFWPDLSEPEQAAFYRIALPCIDTSYADWNLLREAYDRHNFSGTPHEPSAAATIALP